MQGIGESRTGIQRADHLRVYASRLARLLFLRRHCPEGHPVLLTEISLVGMAKSKLRERILADFGARLPEARPRIELAVREAVKAWLKSQVEDPESLESLLGDAEQVSLEPLFTVPN